MRYSAYGIRRTDAPGCVAAVSPSLWTFEEGQTCREAAPRRTMGREAQRTRSAGGWDRVADQEAGGGAPADRGPMAPSWRAAWLAARHADRSTQWLARDPDVPRY